MLAQLNLYVVRLTPGRIALWCYLTWYLATVARYFDPDPTLWLNSLGISGIIGSALLLSVNQPPSADPWQTARLFLMPFCVSSFSALIKGHGFFLVFPPVLGAAIAPVAACTAVLLGIMVVKFMARSA